LIGGSNIPYHLIQVIIKGILMIEKLKVIASEAKHIYGEHKKVVIVAVIILVIAIIL
jgi:hypothetical protein